VFGETPNTARETRALPKDYSRPGKSFRKTLKIQARRKPFSIEMVKA
jgi:hypothetical protein